MNLHKTIARVVGMMGLLVIFLSMTFTAFAGGVVGNGTPGSCTRDAVAAALVGGGSVTFNCGGAATILITSTLEISARDTTIDGGGLITFQAAPGVRIIRHFTVGFNAANTLTLRNLTFTGVSRTGSGEVINGGAVYVQNQSANWNQDLPTLNVENVTFLNNHVTNTQNFYGWDFGGAAIAGLGGIINVNNSRFIGNRATGGSGAAIHIIGSQLTVRNSTFENNVATPTSSSSTDSGYGGAIYVDGTLYRGNGGVYLYDSVFSGNSAANQGGAAYINLYTSRNEPFVVERSVFRNNSVSGGGLGMGGALSGGGTNDGGAQTVFMTVRSSLFDGNRVSGGSQGGMGGAIAFGQTNKTVIVNSTFTNNAAVDSCGNCVGSNGGAIYIANNPQPYELINNTIVRNSAGWVAGAIAANPNGIIRNNIIAFNTAANGGNTWYTQTNCSMTAGTGGNNLQMRTSNPAGDQACAAGTTMVDPLVGTLTGTGLQTIALLPGSPAIDGGNNGVCAGAPVNNVDQRGGVRPIDGNGDGNAVCDVGAYEMSSVNVPPTNTSTATSTRTNTPVAPTATATPTRTNTPVAPTATPTRTNTPVAPTATPTRTNTPVAPTATPTRTNTPVAPTATATATLTSTTIAPTATPTSTRVRRTRTPTNTPTAFPTLPPAASPTPMPTSTPTNTPTNTVVVPTGQPTATVGAAMSVVRFVLINADTDQDIGELTNGMTLNYAQLPTRHLAIRAETNTPAVGSVVFTLTFISTDARTRSVEDTPPYSLFGDLPNAAGQPDYGGFEPQVGRYRLRAMPFTLAGGNGLSGTPLMIVFNVVES